MKRSILFLFGSLIMLLMSAGAHGQGCSATLEPHFSVYTSISRDGETIYTSVTTQGYTNIFQPGCPQMSTATHRAGAENMLSNTGGWNYSAWGCPTCYFSVVNYDQIVGVPGIVYYFQWDGIAMCNVVGQYWGDGGGSNIPGCLVPTTETTTDEGFDTLTYRERFDMTLSDTAGDSFDNHYVQEATASPGSNTCWWSGSRLPQNPGVQGSNWTVGTVNGVTEHNHWGYDSIGWDLPDLDYIVQNGPSNGVTFPCVTTLHQAMQIECDANTWWQYRADDITITVDNNPNSEENCRDESGQGECGTVVPFSDRWTSPRFYWARILNSADSGGLARSSPPLRTAKEARP